MTSVTRETVTTTIQRVLVPLGSPISELQLAMFWATQSAASLGLSTDRDDWAHVTANDEHLVISVREPRRNTFADGRAGASSSALQSTQSGSHYKVVVHLCDESGEQSDPDDTLTLLVDSSDHRYLRLLEGQDDADPDAEEWFKVCRALTSFVADKLGHENFTLHTASAVTI